MAAPAENKYWKLRETHGRPLEYESPEVLRDDIVGYFEYCQENPWYKKEAIKSGDRAGELIDIPTERPFTISGLCNHLGISMSTWKLYCEREGYSNICTYAEEVIRTQKFEGAAVGVYNASIIARDLGLTDKTEVNNKGQSGPTIVINAPGGLNIDFPSNTDAES